MSTRPTHDLAVHALDGATVTVTLTDGRSFTGTPVAVGPAEPHTYSIRTGRRGRPAKVHADDVASIEAAA